MRLTCDIDTKNPLVLLFSIFRGIWLCRSLPEIEKSKKGWHLFWYGLKINQKTMFKYRLLIGDDQNRVRLDMSSDKRIQQVMFNRKIFIKIPNYK